MAASDVEERASRELFSFNSLDGDGAATATAIAPRPALANFQSPPILFPLLNRGSGPLLSTENVILCARIGLHTGNGIEGAMVCPS